MKPKSNQDLLQMPTPLANPNLTSKERSDLENRYIDDHLGQGDVVRLKSDNYRTMPVQMTVEEVLKEDNVSKACVVYFDGEGKLHRDKIRLTSLVYA